MRLDGKVAIVTASTRGIGLACTQRLAREGAIVMPLAGFSVNNVGITIFPL